MKVSALPRPPEPGLELAGPRVRRAVAVLMSRFPLVTETFILREVVEMERQGQPVRLVPLLHEKPPVVHAKAVPWMERALYTPFLSHRILRANRRVFRRHPGRYLRTLALVLAGTATSPGFFLRTLALFPKSVYLAERLQREGIRHLHAHFATHPATVALIISCLSDITFSFTVHAHDIFVRRPLLREKLGKARFVRSISRFNVRFLESCYGQEAVFRVRVIHSGVDVAEYRSRPDEIATEPVASSAPARLICVAALKPYKGLPVLIEALQRLDTEGVAWRCEVVGEGPLRVQLKRRIAELGLAERLQLVGALPEAEVARRLRRASIFVLPSIVARDGQMEGIPVSLMEAMAAAKPVVASRLSGVPELVEDGISGLLVAPGRPDELAGALRRLIDEPVLARRLGRHGRRKVQEEFRLERCVAELLDCLDRYNEPRSLERAEELTGLLSVSGERGVIGLRRLRHSRDSQVAEVSVTGPAGNRELVCKRHLSRGGESKPAPARARREFDLLSRLHRVRLGVPRPVHLDEASACLVMEACRGVRLDSLVRRARWGPDPRRGPGLAEELARTGHWLRRFQEETAARIDPWALLGSLHRRALADLEACGDRLSRRLREKARRRLAELAAALQGRDLRVVGHHGDFWPGNVFVGAEGLQVIDFEGFRHGLGEEDLANFLLHLRLLLWWPNQGSRRAELSAAFMRGYLQARTDRELDPVAWSLCRLTRLLALLAQSGDHLGRRRGWLLRSMLRETLS